MKGKSKISILILLLILVFSLTLAACSAATETNSSSSSITTGESSLTGEEGGEKPSTSKADSSTTSKTDSPATSTGSSKVDSSTSSSFTTEGTTPTPTPTSYTITIDTAIANGSITASKETAKEGETVTLTNTPGMGYGFGSYTVKDASGNTISVNNNSFTMPASNVTVSASFTANNYSITVSGISNGSVTPSKTSAKYGETVTLTNTPGKGHSFGSYTVKDASGNTISVNNNSFTMPASNVTITASFTIKTCTVTVTQPTGGQIKANNSTSFTVNYGTQITLTNSASAGYIFSSYKVNNNSTTNNKYTVTSNTTITGVFNRGIGGINNLNFANNCNYASSYSGDVNKNGNAVTSTQSGFAFVYAEALSDFYYETKVTFAQSDVKNNEGAPKIGIAINYGQEWMFSYIDAISSNGGWGGNTWLIATNGRGTLGSTVDWYWADIAERKYNFNVNYANETTFKLAVLRVGGVYNFFINDQLAYTLWLPEMNYSFNIGFMNFNMGYRCADTKYGYGDTVLNNAKAYLSLGNQNPTTVTVNGYAGDWKNNATTSYGMQSGLKYFYATAFKGSDAVYAVIKARTSNYITNNSNWWESTNVELRNEAKAQQFASANGQKSDGVLSAVFNSKWEGNLCTVTIELKLSSSVFTNGTIGFAFRSEDYASNLQEGNDGVWWCGMHHPDWQRFTATTTGLDLHTTMNTMPVSTSIRFGMYADPFVLVANNKYYMYGTYSTSDYYVYSSTDLKNWVAGDGNGSSRVCFDPKTNNTFVKGGNLWAPEVVYNAKTNKYVMFYSGFLEASGDNHYPKIGVATSDSPVGPFIDVHGAPLLYPNETIASIDGSCFIDDDGQAYLYFAKDCSRNYIENYRNGIGYSVSQIWVIKLDDTYTQTVGEATLCITPDQDWEFNEPGTTCWNEGPYVIKHAGHYYLTYSANPFWNNLYGVGLAFSTSPTGPFKKYADNPIVKTIPGVTAGTGHNMFFKDLNGDLWCAFHTYTKDDLNFKPSSERTYPYRETLLSRAWFKDYVLKIEDGR